MNGRGRVRVAVAALVVTLGVGVTGCVNYAHNSAKFCHRNAQLLSRSQDGLILNQTQANYWDDALEKSMRYSEDGTRKVRMAARSLASAYSAVRSTAGNHDAKQSQVDKVYARLRHRRAEMRAVCAQVDRT